MTETKRYDYLDIAKGLGILAVVWAHIMLVGWSHKVIYAFHMPLFFFISGMLFRREKYSSFGQFVGKRAKRLLVPYLIYSIVTWGIWAAFRWVRHDPVDSYWAPLLQTFIVQGSGAFMVHNSALWFVPCLFVVELMYWGLSALKEWLNIFVCLLLAGLSFLFGYLWGDAYWNLLPFNFDAALIALPFYSVGNVLMKHYSHKDLVDCVSNNRLASLGILFVGTALLVIASLSFGECSMGSSSYQCNGIIFIVRAFLGCAVMILFSMLFSSSIATKTLQQPFIWFGKNSLDVMCLHIPIKGVVMIVIARLLSTGVDNLSSHWGGALLSFALTMVIASVVILFINRFIRK